MSNSSKNNFWDMLTAWVYNRVIGFFGVYKGLPRDIYILFGMKIINAMGNFVFPFLAIFLTNKLGIDKKGSGTLLTIAALAFAPGSILGGKLADHFGRRGVFAFFQLASVVLFVPCAFLNKSMLIPWLLIISSFMNGGSQPPLSAMANDLTEPSNRNTAFSMLYLGNNIGFAFGSMIAGFLFTYHTRALFLGNFITGTAAVIILLKLIKETKPVNIDKANENSITAGEGAEAGNLFSALIKRPFFIAFALLTAIYSFNYAQFPFCGSIQAGPSMYGVLMSLNGFVVITMTTIIIKLTKKNKPLLNIAISGVFFSVGFGMLYFIKGFILFILSTFIWTIGEILNTTNSAVFIANNTPSTHRGRFNAAVQIITGSGFALGPYLMGIYISGKNIRLAWPLVFLLEIGAAFSILILYFVEKKHEKRENHNKY